MSVGAVLLIIVCWVLIAALNKAHRDQKGINMPTRSAVRDIRRSARKKGLSEAAAYDA